MLDNDIALRNSYIEKGLALKEKFSHINIANHLVSVLSQFDKKPIPYKIHEITSSPSLGLTSDPTKLNQQNQTFFFQDDEVKLKKHLSSLSRLNNFPPEHSIFLQNLKKDGFEPKVIYDIGTCVLQWTNEAKKYWPNATYILFDAFNPVEFLYEGYDYHIGVLSDSEKNVKFYQNEYLPAGNSYYREIGCENGKYFPENKFVEKKTRTLDDVVKERGFPLPDFVKIDVQGSEVDIIMGGINTLNNASKLIIELQHTEYNKGALLSKDSVPIIEKELNIKCTDPLFTNNGCDGDYCFTKG
jgi:FkbM family methyltransferase